MLGLVNGVIIISGLFILKGGSVSIAIRNYRVLSNVTNK